MVRTGQRRSGGRLTRSFAALVLAGSFVPVGCSSEEPPSALAVDVAALKTDNGLLTVPEIWFVVNHAPSTEVLYTLARRVVEPEFGWVTDRASLQQLVNAEGDVSARYWALQLGLEVSVPGDVQALVDEASAALPEPGALTTLHRAMVVADAGGAEVTLGEPARAALRTLAVSERPGEVWPAREVLELAGEPVAAPDASAEWIEGEHRIDDERLFDDFYAWFVLHGGDAGTGVGLDDWFGWCTSGTPPDEIFHTCVAALDGLGGPERARAVFDAFDPDRVEEGKGVLDSSPDFSGTLASTERVLRYLRGVGGGEFPDDVSATLPSTEAVRAAMKEQRGDPLAVLAGTAILHVLEPGSVSEGERRAAVDDALDLLGSESDELSPEKVRGWSEIAGRARVLGVELAPRRMSQEARDQVLVDDPNVMLLLADYLRTWVAAGASPAEVSDLTAGLRSLLEPYEPEQLPTPVLLGGSLALREAGVEPPFTGDELRAEIERRRGSCKGGATSFLRDYRAEGSVCNVDATLMGLQVLAR